MRYRVLGKTGLNVSEIGFGAWGIGGGMWGKVDDHESLKALYKAFELGINFYDTAWVYGDSVTRDGRSEELIGRFAREVGRDSVYLASKVPPKNFKWPALSGIPLSEVFPKEWIIEKVESSLARLGVETIDLMQFHVWQDSFVEDSQWKEAAEMLTNQGKVRYWGLSLNDYQPGNCRRTIEDGFISSVQLIFNIFHQEPAGMLPYFKDHKIGVIARVPFDEGGLTGSIREDTVFSNDDFRGDYFSTHRKKELAERISELEKLLGNEALSLTELALRYILSFGEVSTVIPGMRKSVHVESNTAVSDGRSLSNKLLENLKKHVWERNFYNSKPVNLRRLFFEIFNRARSFL